MRKARRPKRHRDPAHPHVRARSACGLPHRRADRLAQPVVLHRVAPQPACIRPRHNQRSRRAIFPRPVLRVLQHPRIRLAHGRRPLRAEQPSARPVHRQQHADLVIAEPVRMQFLHMVKRAVMQKSPHVRIPQRKRQATHKSLVGEIQTLVVVVVPIRPVRRSPVPEVQAVIVSVQHAARIDRIRHRVSLPPSPRVVVHHVEHHRDAVHVQQIHHHLHLRIARRNVL